MNLDAAVFGTVLKRLNSILSQDEFASNFQLCKETFLETLCVKPWSSEQFSTIFGMMQHIVPTCSRFNPAGKDNFIEFVTNSHDIQWSWSKSNPKAMLYFSECGEVLAVVLQKLKSLLSPDEFASFCKQFKEESILETLSAKPWNSKQFSSILDMLQHISPKNWFYKFNQSGKDKFIDFIESSQDIQWLWSKSNPKAIKYFSDCAEVLASVLQKLKTVNHNNFASICNEFLPEYVSNVQLLSVKPFTANQIVTMWDLLKLKDNGKEQGSLLRGVVNWLSVV